MNPQTPIKIIYVVVITLAILSLICVGSLAGILYFKTYADPAVLTSFTLLTGNVTGALMAILSNLRQQPKSPNGEPVPAPVEVKQPQDKPIPVEQVEPKP